MFRVYNAKLLKIARGLYISGFIISTAAALLTGCIGVIFLMDGNTVQSILNFTLCTANISFFIRNCINLLNETERKKMIPTAEKLF